MYSRITNVWTITLKESEVFNRVTDESLRTNDRLAGKVPPTFISDEDKAYFHRYYLEALSELSVMLARRTARFGGGIETDPETGETTYSLAMSGNHESELLHSLASHCLEFVIAYIIEKWYGAGTDFGSREERRSINTIIHFRRHPVERQLGPVF